MKRRRFVEHLSELRHRIFISFGALVPAFVVTFAFHDHLIGWLERPLPGRRAARHSRSRRAVHDGRQGERARGDRDRAADPRLAGVGIPGARGRPGARSAFSPCSWIIATGLFATGVTFAYFVVLPAAVKFLTNFDDSLYNIQIRASYYLSFTSVVLLPAASLSRCRSSSSRS